LAHRHERGGPAPTEAQGGGASELIIKIAKLAGDERGDARVREIA